MKKGLIILFLFSAGLLEINAQSVLTDDPAELYLRLLETEKRDSRLPSLNVRPASLEGYIPDYNLDQSHPWQELQMFQSWRVRRDSISVISGYNDMQHHVVNAGETLYRIGKLNDVTVEELMELNNLSNYLIHVGQRLIVKREYINIEIRTPYYVADAPADVIQFYTPIIRRTFNNNFPLGHNDSHLWQGRGWNSSVSAGFLVSHGPIRASIRPTIVHSENRDFELSKWPAASGISEYGYEFSRIDYPQRFGDNSVTRLYPGQSWIRAEYREFSAGLSTANIVAGPALYNPLLFSNNAPGFLHAFLGTHKPYETDYGSIEGKLIWGMLSESGFFREDGFTEKRLLNGLILNYSPSFVQGLHIGLSRVFVKSAGSEEGISFLDYFMMISPMKKPDDDGRVDRLQMSSFFARWQIPDYGFEVYGEWSRNAPAVDFKDLLLQPEQSRAYTLGFINRFNLASRHWLLLNYEMTQLEAPRLVQFRDLQSYYISPAVLQGYTHRGQIIGAGIGPGSNSQRVKLDYYHPLGLVGASFNRIVHDNDRLYKFHEIIGLRPWGIRNPRISTEVEFRYGVNSLFFLPGNFELQIDLYRSKFFHYRHRVLPEEIPDVYNTNLRITLRYGLSGWMR